MTETYCAGAGVISGYAAQRTLFAKGHAEPNAFVTAADGREFLYGDPINDSLLGQLPGDTVGVIDIAVGASMACGLEQPQMDEISRHFEYVASQIGDPFFPSIPESHQSVRAERGHPPIVRWTPVAVGTHPSILHPRPPDATLPWNPTVLVVPVGSGILPTGGTEQGPSVVRPTDYTL